MDTDEIAVFVTAAEAGSLSQAARRLGLTPMLATRRLASLEDGVGVRLMQRTTRSLSLTPEGEAFMPFAQAILDNEEQARSRLRRETTSASGLLRVSVPIEFGIKVVAPLLPGLLTENPELRISLDMSDALPDLVSTGTDVAIRIARLKDSGLIARKLADNPRTLVASPAYLAKGVPKTLEDLSRFDCLPMSSVSHWTFIRDGSETHWRVNARFSSSSIAGCHAACLAGGGIALLSEWNVKEDIEAGRLINVRLSHAVPETIAIWAVYPTTRMVLPKVNVFISLLRSTLDGRDKLGDLRGAMSGRSEG